MEAGVMTMAAKMDLTNKFSHKHYVMLRKNNAKAADEYISKFRDIKNNNFSVEINGEEVTTTEVIQEPEVDAEDKEKDELVAKLRAA